MENEIIDQNFDFDKIESKSESKYFRKLIRVKGEFLKSLIPINEIPELKGLNREVKTNDWLIRRDVSRLCLDKDYFIKERTILINKRNLHIIDGQHTRLAGLKFMKEYPELSKDFEVCLEVVDIPTLAEEERMIREKQLGRQWTTTMFFEQGLVSFDKNRKENHKRYEEIFNYLKFKFESETLKKKTLINITGYTIGISNLSDKLKKSGDLSVSIGDVTDAKYLIDKAFELEIAAIKGNKYSNFSLSNGKFWVVFRELFKKLSYFDIDKFIKHVETNSVAINWWDGDKGASISCIRKSVLIQANLSKSIKSEDFISYMKAHKLTSTSSFITPKLKMKL